MTNNNRFNKLMLSSKKTARVIILPALGKLSDLDLNLRNWLSRSNASYTSTHKHILNHLLSFFGEQEKVTNFGALRYFGETSKKPKQYIAAADPVIIQTHGNQLSIKTVRHSVEIVKEISKDFIEIQNQISNNIAVKLSHNGLNGYLLFEKLFPTSIYSPSELSDQAINSVAPNDDLSGEYGNLINEIQMIIHNSHNIKHGLFNSLWVWGGGKLVPRSNISLPKLLSDDPIIRGFWAITKNEADDFKSEFDNFLKHEDGAFVAVTPEDTGIESSSKNELESFLLTIYRYHKEVNPEQLVLIFRDGWQMQIKPLHKYFFWRNTKSLQSIKSLYYAN